VKRNEDFKADLLAELRRDPDYAPEYLSAAKADSNDAFLVALRDVAEARKGMRKVAKEAGVNRESLYRALSKNGNPSISTLDAVLRTLGIDVKFVASQRSDSQAQGLRRPASTARPRARKRTAA
jgi:probable addiction module antidote protein